MALENESVQKIVRDGVFLQDRPRDLFVGHLELGEKDGAVLRPPPVYHRDDLVASVHCAVHAKVLHRAVDLKDRIVVGTYGADIVVIRRNIFTS